jgi:uncharacterized alpha-E superfamily protein
MTRYQEFFRERAEDGDEIVVALTDENLIQIHATGLFSLVNVQFEKPETAHAVASAMLSAVAQIDDSPEVQKERAYARRIRERLTDEDRETLREAVDAMQHLRAKADQYSDDDSSTRYEALAGRLAGIARRVPDEQSEDMARQAEEAEPYTGPVPAPVTLPPTDTE